MELGGTNFSVLKCRGVPQTPQGWNKVEQKSPKVEQDFFSCSTLGLTFPFVSLRRAAPGRRSARPHTAGNCGSRPPIPRWCAGGYEELRRKRPVKGRFRRGSRGWDSQSLIFSFQYLAYQPRRAVTLRFCASCILYQDKTELVSNR